jgi:hypothetical protein
VGCQITESLLEINLVSSEWKTRAREWLDAMKAKYKRNSPTLNLKLYSIKTT